MTNHPPIGRGQRCDEVRAWLLTADPAELSDGPHLAHLSTCATCGELAAAVIRADSDIRQHVEDFVNATSTLDAAWAAAVDRAGPAPSRRWATTPMRVALAVAAAAALVVAVAPRWMPGPPNPPEDPGAQRLLGAGVVPEAMREARERVDAFEAIDTEHLDLAGLDRQAEDARMIDALSRKAAAMTEAERAFTAAAADADPVWRVAALGELGDLYASMADALWAFPRPSYLDDAQREAYDGALADKVSAQRARALDALDQAIGLATNEGLTASVAELEPRIQALQQAIAAADQARLDQVVGDAGELRVAVDRAGKCVDARTAATARVAIDGAVRAGGRGLADLAPGELAGVARALDEATDAVDDATARCRKR